MKEPSQEMMQKFMMFEQQIKHLQQQLQAVEQGIVEMGSLSLGIGELGGSEGKEILAPIGRGIFARAKLLSEDLTVDVGDRNFVKKNIPDTQEIIAEQIKKLEDVKVELQDNLEKLSQEMTRVILEGQGEKGEEK